jgi:hypothetical protein
VTGEWRWLGSSSVEFVPEKPLDFGTAYVLTVPAGVVALDGATLAAPVVVEFETPRPELESISPSSGLPIYGYEWRTAPG